MRVVSLFIYARLGQKHHALLPSSAVIVDTAGTATLGGFDVCLAGPARPTRLGFCLVFLLVRCSKNLTFAAGQHGVQGANAAMGRYLVPRLQLALSPNDLERYNHQTFLNSAPLCVTMGCSMVSAAKRGWAVKPSQVTRQGACHSGLGVVSRF